MEDLLTVISNELETSPLPKVKLKKPSVKSFLREFPKNIFLSGKVYQGEEIRKISL